MSNESGFSQRFVAEAREHLAAMTSAMIALERNEGNPQHLLEQLLRAAHSIKGGAGFTGRRHIEQLSHAFEEAIENIRDGRVARSPEVVDTLLAVLDRIAAMVDDVDRSDEVDITDPMTRLRPLIEGRAAHASVPAAAARGDDDQSTSLARDFTLSDRLLAAWPVNSACLLGIKLDWYQCEQQFGLSPLAVAERLERTGRILESRTHPSGPGLAEGLPGSALTFLAIVASDLGVDEFSRRLGIPCATIVLLRERPPATETTKPPAKAEANASASAPTGAPAATSLRVSVPLVDRMMALAGELVLVRNQAMRAADPANPPLRRLLRRLDSVTNELQDAALRMRTQPVGTLFDRFPRVVRDLARQLGKQIDVKISGSEVELDKTILELLADPLTHLIRNCCDHGIGTPEERTRAGKPPGGRIDLSARQERGQMVIEIRDDGRGIDVQAIRRKAIENGLKRGDELERMSDRQIFGLILLSGFSTAARVTDLSGRGVGMDVVKTNLDQIGGVVEIDSAPGKGSVFTLRLPLTLAIMPCLLLGSDEQCYGVPQRDVEEIVLLDPANARRRIEQSHENEVLRWRGQLPPVVRLREILRRRQPCDAAALREIAQRYQRADPSTSNAYAVVIRFGSRRFVLVFDKVIGSENIVVKPLHALLRPLGIYAATTILGDGNVALILNSEGVARHSGILQRLASEPVTALPGPGAAAEPEEPVLLFRYGPQELLAMRMNGVRRVVAITADRIERIGDREMVNVDGAATNVLRLDRLLKISPCAETGRLFLVLPRNGSSPVGLLVSEVVDTPTLSVQLDPRAYQADGVLGSAMIRGEIVLFIDLDAVVTMWEQTRDAAVRAALPDRSAKRILVVDDTKFFQKLVAEHLRSERYEVKVADNGRDGLAMLRAERFDLVVSDIEMPVMDGHALAREVRADPQLAGIPLVALTTLNTPQSRATAMGSGFDAYQVKLDRQTFLAIVGDLLARTGAPTNA
jgi:two-component system chemotaxis sensor kinase CheA